MQKILASDGLILTFFSGGDAQGARSFTGAPPPPWNRPCRPSAYLTASPSVYSVLHLEVYQIASLHCALWTTIKYTLCVVGVDAGNDVNPSTGPPTSDGILYILHMGDGTIPTGQQGICHALTVARCNQTVIKQYKLHPTSYTKHKLTDDVQNLKKICEVNTFYGTLELWKGTKIYSVGKRIPTNPIGVY